MARKVKLIKMNAILWEYIKRVGEAKYGKGLSMPLILYKLAKEAERNGRRR